MSDVNIMDHINEDGTFKDSLREHLADIVGDDHKDSKLLENIPNVSTALKVMFDSKSALGKKFDAHIPKPGKDATPEQIAEFRKAVFETLGAPKKAEEYEFPRIEGRPYDEEAEKVFRQFFFEKGYPKELVTEVLTKFNEFQTGRIEAYEARQKQVLDEQRGKIDELWAGDKKVKMNRLAYNAAMEFSPDEDLKGLLKELKVFDHPTNHDLWEKAGVFPNQRIFLAKVGDKMKSPEPPPNEAGAAEKSEKGDFTDYYTHETSRAAMAAENKG